MGNWDGKTSILTPVLLRVNVIGSMGIFGAGAGCGPRDVVHACGVRNRLAGRGLSYARITTVFAPKSPMRWFLAVDQTNIAPTR